MEKVFTHFAKVLFYGLVPGIFLISSSGLAAQKVSDLYPDEKLESSVWKTGLELNQSVASEQAFALNVLQDIQLPPQDRAIIMAYQALLANVLSRVQSGATMTEAISQSYEKVLEEAPGDILMKHLPEGALAGLLPRLIEALQDTPVYVPVEVH